MTWTIYYKIDLIFALIFLHDNNNWTTSKFPFSTAIFKGVFWKNDDKFRKIDKDEIELKYNVSNVIF